MSDVSVSTEQFRLMVQCLENAGVPAGKVCKHSCERINYQAPVANVWRAGAHNPKWIKLFRAGANYPWLTEGTQMGSMGRQCDVTSTGVYIQCSNSWGQHWCKSDGVQLAAMLVQQPKSQNKDSGGCCPHVKVVKPLSYFLLVKH